MRPIAGVQDDWASVIQAYVEITQTMTSAHDILVRNSRPLTALLCPIHIADVLLVDSTQVEIGQSH